MKKRKLKVLFLDILTDKKDQRKMVEKRMYGGGTYSDHVRKVFGLQKDEWRTIYADKSKFPSVLPRIDALVIGGSAKDPVRGQNNEWMRQSYKFINKIIKADTPVLGICGGLQFVIKALGGEIIYTPKGREFGTITIKVKKTDPIFSGIGNSFKAQSNHQCMVGEVTFPMRILAGSKVCPIQAVAIGDKIRLVQFHPERRKHQTQAILEMVKKDHYESTPAGKLAYAKLKNSIKDTSKTDKIIIKNFLNHFVYPHIQP